LVFLSLFDLKRHQAHAARPDLRGRRGNRSELMQAERAQGASTRSIISFCAQTNQGVQDLNLAYKDIRKFL
jgi:hypothetical protein